MDIFIVAATGRCGSTFLMRLLQSHPDIWMWGESEEIFRAFFDLQKRIKSRVKPRNKSWKKWERHGLNSFCPNLLPKGDPESLVVNSINHFFTPPNQEKHVGCKFILLTPKETIELRNLFPSAKFLFLYRNIEDTLISIGRRNFWKRKTEDDWRKRHDEMLSFFYSKEVEGLIIDYDKIKESVDQIEDYIEIKGIDRSVFNYKTG